MNPDPDRWKWFRRNLTTDRLDDLLTYEKEYLFTATKGAENPEALRAHLLAEGIPMKRWVREQKREQAVQRRTTSIEDMLTEPYHEGFLPALVAAEEAAELVAVLPKREREAVIATFLHSLSRDEAATALGVTPSAVDKARRDGIKRLRAVAEK